MIPINIKLPERIKIDSTNFEIHELEYWHVEYWHELEYWLDLELERHVKNKFWWLTRGLYMNIRPKSESVKNYETYYNRFFRE